jgi:hypothetical protein
VFAKTVGGLNLSSDLERGNKEVSGMSDMEVFTLLILITNIIALVVNICNNKKK